MMYLRVAHTRDASRKFSIVKVPEASLSDLETRLRGSKFMLCDVATLGEQGGPRGLVVRGLVPDLISLDTIYEIQPYLAPLIEDLVPEGERAYA